jgi:hypothetical protein
MTQSKHPDRIRSVAVLFAVCASLVLPFAVRGAHGATCAGDCSGTGVVTVAQLVTIVNIALGTENMSACTAADVNGDGRISIDELVRATMSALNGCASAGPTPTPGGSTQCNAAPFTSTFDAIQQVIFEKHGCTADVCHGSVGKQGGMQLTADVSYQNIFQVKSTESDLNRIQPGDKDRSYLWLKLAASTNPADLPPGFQISGAPMPNGLPALSADELEALRLWIYAGAPQTGTVAGTDTLLNACLPTPEPILITPLDPPAPGTGVQFTMPPWHLEAHSEHELCFATYYDITQQVPAQYQDPSGTLFRFNTTELRQDPQSHHLILNRYIGPATDVHDPSIGAWTCNGGDKAGQTCEPTDLTSCGTGICTSEIKQSFACIGFGPTAPNPAGSGSFGQNFYAIGGAQSAQAHTQFLDGVFAQIPMKGILYWNSHAFNLTDEDTTMHAWLNYSFSDAQQYPVQSIFNISKIFSANAAPYTTQTLCQDHQLPQGARLFNLSSHTHKHGKHFTVTVPDGSTIYESFIYNDPANITFDPPMKFDSADQAQRILHYCSLYNNGVNPDGSPDPTLVTRESLIPASARNTIGGHCKPVACVAGAVGAPCNGEGDDRTCDSSPGANDGLCDACPITGGESTQNEMFILIGSYYIADTTTASDVVRALDSTGRPRSMSTEVALPPQIGCSSSHAGHAGHMAQ